MPAGGSSTTTDQVPTRRERSISSNDANPARYADVAMSYRNNGFAPVPVRGKRPVPAGATGREGTVTDSKIAEWIADPEWAGQNVALRAEGFIVLDVDAYDDKHGDDELAALEAGLGSLPATITSTSRGQGHPSRQHFYKVPEDLEFATSAGESIDVLQRGHRYAVVAPSTHPDTLQPYQWYDYDGEPLAEPPHRSDFETLPDAWIEHLKVERSVYNHEQRVAEKVASASPDEERQLNSIIRELESLPREWKSGDGWHDTVMRSAHWLWRMVNANDYALTEDQAEDIIFTFTPTWPEWGQDRIAEQWESARRGTVGQTADAPESSLPVPQDLLEVANLLPAGHSTARGESFTDLLFNDPEIATEKSFWLRRHEILIEAMRAGLNDEQAASLAYGSTSGMLLQIEPTGIAKLWREVAKAREVVERESGKGVEAPPTEERGGLGDRMRRLELMTDAERDEANAVQWFGSEYMDFAEESVSVMNAPYHRANRWMILSAVYSPHGVIPIGGGRTMPCNVYIMVVGDTTTGKSESVDLSKTVPKAFYNVDTNPFIGGNASPNALIEKLIMRDGQASIFISDEAHGHIKAMRQGGWLNQLPEILTDLYGGNVPMILRNGNKDISGIDATTYFIMHYAGTMKGLSEVLLPEDWESGFLNRFVWAIGEKSERTRDSMKIKLRRPGDKAANIDPRQMQKHWAAEFASNIRTIGSTGGGPVELDIDAEVEDRHNDLNWKLSTMTDGHRHEHMLKPTFIRFSTTILKLACLVAMSMGEKKVTRIHHLIATEQAEEWAANILAMVERTTESGFTKKVDDLERFIASQPDRRSRLERIYNHMKLPVYDTDKFLTQLVAEGRVRKFQNNQLHNLVEIIEQQKEVAA